MKKSVIYLGVILFPALYLISCTDVIDVNLNDSDPRLIIESSISDQSGSCIAKLSKSVNFSEPNTFPAVSGAEITIADDIGNTAKLHETLYGTYKASIFSGKPGRRYTLTILVDGQIYTANSTMPEPVIIDTLEQENFSIGAFGNNDVSKIVIVKFHDPPVSGNYYRFVQQVNNCISSVVFIDDDKFQNGGYVSERLYHPDSTLVAGQRVTIFMQSIDKPVFDYFDTLGQLTGGGRGGQAATPTNPTSNFGGGALGYFSAYAAKSREIIIH